MICSKRGNFTEFPVGYKRNFVNIPPLKGIESELPDIVAKAHHTQLLAAMHTETGHDRIDLFPSGEEIYGAHMEYLSL